MKRVLIVVDMQNDFVDGALGTSEAQAIVPNVKKKIAEYRARKDQVVFTMDTHREDYLSTNEGKHLPVKHCISEAHGWELVEGLNRKTEDIVIYKPSFGYTHWKNIAYGISDADEIELVGLCTDICVVSNALILKALFPEAKICVDASCCAGVTPESHKAALLTMKMCQIEIMGDDGK